MRSGWKRKVLPLRHFATGAYKVEHFHLSSLRTIYASLEDVTMAAIYMISIGAWRVSPLKSIEYGLHLSLPVTRT